VREVAGNMDIVRLEPFVMNKHTEFFPGYHWHWWTKNQHFGDLHYSYHQGWFQLWGWIQQESIMLVFNV